jgi:hypothetical protein
MPCPYFEPQQVARDGQAIHGRLPLFDEYNGWCHRSGQVQPIPLAVRFSGCNHGHPDSGCTLLLPGENRCNRRFHVRGKTGGDRPTLEVLILEIQDGTPVRSHAVLYSKADERLEPDIQDPCERAQVLAFCRSYFRRFPYPVTP